MEQKETFLINEKFWSILKNSIENFIFSIENTYHNIVIIQRDEVDTNKKYS